MALIDDFLRHVTEDELNAVTSQGFYGSLAGFLVGGFAGVRETGRLHMAEHQSTRYASNLHQVSHLNNAVLKGFFVDGARSGARAGLICSVYGAGVCYLENYRHTRDMGNIMLAASAMVGLPRGLRGLCAGAAIGLCFGTVLGAGMQALWAAKVRLTPPTDHVLRAASPQRSAHDRLQDLRHARHVQRSQSGSVAPFIASSNPDTNDIHKST